MRVRWLVLAAVLALSVVACGNSDGDDSASGDSANETTEAPDTSTDATSSTPSDSSSDTEADVAADDFTEFVSFEETGVSDDTIRVASITAATNQLGGPYGDLDQGIQLYFDKVNDDGGIWGRQLELSSTRDDALANNLAEAEALVAQDDAYAAFIATVLFTGHEVLAEEGIPTFGWNINPEWAGKQNFFPNSGALCLGCTGRLLPWLASELGYTKIAVAGYGTADQSKKCASGVRDSFEAYDVGADVVYFDDALQFGQTDFSAQVSAMKDAGAELITTCMDLNGVFGLAREMQLQDYDPVFYHPNMYDTNFVAENAELFDGDYVLPGFTALEHEPENPAVQEFVDAVGDEEFSEITVQGWIAAKQFVDALKAAGPEFTREALIDAWNQQTAFSADGWLAPIDWTIQHEDPVVNPDKRAPLACSNLVQIEDGAFVSAFTEGELQWLCFDDTIEELGEPELMSFAG